MDRKAAKARIRQEWKEEARENEEQERQIARQQRKWVLATALLGVGFTATCAGLVPFLAGHSLHQQWDTIGKKLLLLTMALYLSFVLVATNCLIQWNYLRSIRKIHAKYAPPNIKYKKS
jgi:hypothetical protein